MDTPGKRPQLTQASTVSPEDTVVIIQGGFQKKLPISYLLAAGQSGWSGFSGFSGTSGLNGEYAASGFSGFSGFSGEPGKSIVVITEASNIIYSDQNGGVTGSKNITTDGNTLTLSADQGPQLITQKNKQGRSIQITSNETDNSISFHSQPYFSTYIGNGIPGENQGDDLVLSTSTYGVGIKEILRVVNSELKVKLSRNLTIAQSEEFAGLSIPVGKRPNLRNDGDIWREHDGLYTQIGIDVIGPLSAMNVITPWKKTSVEILTNGIIRSLGECIANDLFYRRVGDSMECRIDIRQIKALNDATSNEGDYLIVVPDGLTIDAEKINFLTSSSLMTVGSGILYDIAPNIIGFQPRDEKIIGIIVNNTSWHSKNHSLNNNIFNLCGTFTLPIKEWK